MFGVRAVVTRLRAYIRFVTVVFRKVKIKTTWKYGANQLSAGVFASV